MSTPKDEEIKIRVPTAMKAAVKKLADSRFTSESAIAREALLEYLANHGAELRPTDASAAPNSVVRASKKDRLAPIVDIVKKHHPRSVPPKAQK